MIYNNQDFVLAMDTTNDPITGLTRKLCVQEISRHETVEGERLAFQAYLYLTENEVPVQKPQLNNPYQLQFEVTTEKIRRIWPGEASEIAFANPYASINEVRANITDVINLAAANNLLN